MVKDPFATEGRDGVPNEERFLKAVRKNDLKEVKRLIGNDPSLVDKQDNNSYFSEEQHAYRDAHETDKSELQRKQISNSAMHFACTGYPDKTRKEKNDDGEDVDVPIEGTGVEESLKMIEFLIERGSAKLESSNDFGSTCLHVAAANGHHRIVRQLIKEGSKMEARNTIGNTPLHCAVYAGSIEAAEELLQAFKDHGKGAVEQAINNANGVGMDCMAYARDAANLEMQDYLMKAQGGQLGNRDIQQLN